MNRRIVNRRCSTSVTTREWKTLMSPLRCCWELVSDRQQMLPLPLSSPVNFADYMDGRSVTAKESEIPPHHYQLYRRTPKRMTNIGNRKQNINLLMCSAPTMHVTTVFNWRLDRYQSIVVHVFCEAFFLQFQVLLKLRDTDYTLFFATLYKLKAGQHHSGLTGVVQFACCDAGCLSTHTSLLWTWTVCVTLPNLTCLHLYDLENNNL